MLPAWWESQYFPDVERAALTITERVDVDAILSEQQIAAVTWVAIGINAWNRIAITSHYPVAA